MKAMVLEAVGSPLALKELSIPEPGSGEVLVKVMACGVCPTDVKVIQGAGPKARLPVVLGHEAAGEVVKVGSGSDFKVGQRVVIHPHIYCGRCQNCIEGMESVCMNIRGSMGFTMNGGLAEYTVSPSSNLVLFPNTVSFEDGALAGGTVAVPFSAIRKLGSVMSRWVLVLGLGALGLNALQILRAAGANVVAVGRKKPKLDLAKSLGAAEVFDSTKGDYSEFARKVTGQGVDAALDMAGAAAEIPHLLKSLRRGGRLVVVGYSSGNFEAPYQAVVTDGLQIIGSRSYSRQDLRGAVELVTIGKVKPQIDSRFTLEKTNDALAAVREGKLIGRAVVTP
ncbi:MAG: alcohol dehydrogenase catalytic domain-containing protein [Nitrososphaerota archaeon]|nr:alcohol dehydrogenase catalytic domain-containing protein [Nitrososphaerota archaeon]